MCFGHTKGVAAQFCGFAAGRNLCKFATHKGVCGRSNVHSRGLKPVLPRERCRTHSGSREKSCSAKQSGLLSQFTTTGREFPAAPLAFLRSLSSHVNAFFWPQKRRRFSPSTFVRVSEKEEKEEKEEREVFGQKKESRCLLFSPSAFFSRSKFFVFCLFRPRFRTPPKLSTEKIRKFSMLYIF